MKCQEVGCERESESRGLCEKHYMRWYRANSGEVGRVGRPRRTACALPGCDLPPMASHKHANYMSYCSEDHKRQADRDRYAADPERWRRQTKKWAEENRERMLANVKRWQAENSERRRLARQKYSKAHPEKAAESWRRRRARLIGAEGSHTFAEVQELFARMDNRCAYQMPGCTFTATAIDHIVPLARGGSDSIENLMPACKSCNSKKNARLLSELASDGLLDPSHPLLEPPGS